jgi:hypothetical protein
MNVFLLVCILASVFFILFGLAVYVIINLLKKINVYERWVEYFGGEINIMHRRLKMVDDKNLFEKDDDVGFVFSEIVRVMEEFNNNLK